MKTKYKYICFRKFEEKPKTSVWHCRNLRSDALLGVVKWYGPWRQYCFIPESGTIFSISCHDDIDDFIRQLAKEKI